MGWARVLTKDLDRDRSIKDSVVIDRKYSLYSVPMSSSSITIPRKQWRVGLVHNGNLVEIIGIYRSREEADIASSKII